MARPRREEMRQEMAEQIKSIARKQMADLGTTGLSLRGIAREMEITAPALYHYFPRLDDLITALLVDGFNSLAESMQRAADAAHGNFSAKFEAAVAAYRAWALSQPAEFHLLYGNPIPGYAAPFEVTAPLARRPFFILANLLEQGIRSGEMRIPAEYAQIPASNAAHIASWQTAAGINAPPAWIYLLVAGWARIHGMVVLELFGHLQPAIGDAQDLYQDEVRRYLNMLRA